MERGTQTYGIGQVLLYDIIIVQEPTGWMLDFLAPTLYFSTFMVLELTFFLRCGYTAWWG
jgi:hypothetical protein